jgi:hypothetical protein
MRDYFGKLTFILKPYILTFSTRLHSDAACPQPGAALHRG